MRSNKTRRPTSRPRSSRRHCAVVPRGRGRRIRQDRDHGGPGGLVGSQRPGATRTGARANFHSQGGRRTRGAGAAPARQLAANGLVDAEVISAADPTISTYDAYAGRIVAENALRIGREPGQRLIPQTVAWQYARRVVDAYDGPMNEVLVSPVTVTNDVRALAEGLAQHRVTSEQLRDVLRSGCTPCSRRCPRRRTNEPRRTPRRHRGVARALAARCQLLPIVAAYDEAKRRRECLDFADQMALAADLAGAVPRGRARPSGRPIDAVLLDEYQDTSHAQLVFLRALFGAFHPGLELAPLLTAVGDPLAVDLRLARREPGTHERVSGQFPDAGEPASVLSLRPAVATTAPFSRWRTGRRTVARRVASRRRASPARGTRRTVRCAAASVRRVDDEAEAVVAARRLRAVAGRPGRSSDQAHAEGHGACWSASVAQLPLHRSQALRARGLPIEVVDVGGLLTVPEVADVVATLQVHGRPHRAATRWSGCSPAPGGGSVVGTCGAAARGRGTWRGLRRATAWVPTAEVPKAQKRTTSRRPLASIPIPTTSTTAASSTRSTTLPAPGRFTPKGLSATGHARMFRFARRVARTTVETRSAAARSGRRCGRDDRSRRRGARARRRPERDAGQCRSLGRCRSGRSPPAAMTSVLPTIPRLPRRRRRRRAWARPSADEPESTLPGLRQGTDVRRDRVQCSPCRRPRAWSGTSSCVPGLVENRFPGVRPADAEWVTQRGPLP